MFCVNFFDVSDQNEQREKIIAKDEHEMKNIFAFQLRRQPSCIKKKTHQTVNIHMWCFSILELNLEDEEEEEVDRKSSESEKRHSLYGHSHMLNKIDSY